MKAMFRWVVALGITGLLCGYVGPIVFDPDANQGPLLGIFITGPAGALAGLVLGVLARVLPWSPAVERKALLASCAVLALGTLWYSLPGPRTRGMLLEASVTGCILPDALEETALADWDSRIAKVTWTAPRVGWKDDAKRLFAHPDGVVLDLAVTARSAAREQRKPWNSGRISIEPEAGAGDVSRVFVRYAGASCRDYSPGPTNLYYETTIDPQPGPWPPDDLPGLLGLVEAAPPPTRYLAGASSSG
ncbi:MAG TPA: hypothetical protein PK681_08825 [Steroidobacteraceae bacterium]|nr:hypothetical protein [Steroidobacteraceae bacterium]HQZ80708.1 hypothetical protein [Steroidobacteraceae bacterium]